MKNKGFSLVELLVAISIAAVVAGSVGYFLTTSLRMFGNETTDVEQQQELQTTLNTIVDYAMESQTVVLKNSGTQTEYLALGTIGDSDSKNLNAEIFFTDDNKLYMVKKLINDYEKTQDVSPKNLDERVNQIKTDVLSDSTSLPQYLLAENVSSFFVDINGLKTEGTNRYYNNPLSLDVALEFTKMGSSKEINKKVSDKAVLRNTLKTKIYIDNFDYGIKEDVLEISTETVEFEEHTGRIQIPGTSTVRKEGLNILEIIPDYCYDYVQYAVGGYDGKLNNAVNITYGSSAAESGYMPITPEELEGYFIRTCGGKYGNEVLDPKTNLFLNNNGADLQAIILTPEVYKNGYYEYVGKNKGVYAIGSYDEYISVAENPGNGDAKPNVISYTKANNPWGEDKKLWIDKVFNPKFEFCAESIPDEDFYKVDMVSRDSGGDYIEETEEINDKTYTYYKYVGANNGDYFVSFYKDNDYAKHSYDADSGYCYRVSQEYEVVDKDNGQYYARINGWEKREQAGYDRGTYEKGFDFNRFITDATMYSKYSTSYSYTSAASEDFGWVWHDVDLDSDSGLYAEIEDGTARTYIGTLWSGLIKTEEEFTENTRLYLKGHRKYGIVNNDLFKLFVMQDTLEQYVADSPKMLDIKNGRWDETNNTYSTVNDEAIKAWENAGNKITVNVRTPGDIVDGPNGDIANCDMIIFGYGDGDGGFNSAKVLYNLLRNTSVSAKEYSASNDLTFQQATEIYLRVCDEDISIACPYEFENKSEWGKELNLSKMYKMVYCVSNYDKYDSRVADTLGNAKEKKIEEQGENNYWSIDPDYMKDIKVTPKGSGRELFKDYLISMEGKELSKSLYDNHTLPNKTTDFIYIDSDGNIVIPAQGAKSVSQKIGTTTHTYNNRGYDRKVYPNFDIYTDSAYRNFGNFEATFLLRNYTGNDFLLDRYRTGQNIDDSGRRLYPKNEFVYNEEYGYRYRFYYDSAHEGVYKNALLYIKDSSIFTFYKSGGSGMLTLGAANQNSHPMAEIDDPDDIGTLEFVGADDKEGCERRMAELSDSLTYTYENNPTKYTFRFEKLGNGTNQKVFYMSTEDYEKAKEEGLDLYVLVKTSKDPSNYNKCVLHYERNQDDWATWGRYGRFDYDAGDTESIENNESSANVIKYKAGNSVQEAYVREYKYHADKDYFKHIYAPNNNGNNYIEARIDAGGGREYRGSDVIYFIIRDEFDLD